MQMYAIFEWFSMNNSAWSLGWCHIMTPVKPGFLGLAKLSWFVGKAGEKVYKSSQFLTAHWIVYGLCLGIAGIALFFGGGCLWGYDDVWIRLKLYQIIGFFPDFFLRWAFEVMVNVQWDSGLSNGRWFQWISVVPTTRLGGVSSNSLLPNPLGPTAICGPGWFHLGNKHVFQRSQFRYPFGSKPATQYASHQQDYCIHFLVASQLKPSFATDTGFPGRPKASMLFFTSKPMSFFSFWAGSNGASGESSLEATWRHTVRVLGAWFRKPSGIWLRTCNRWKHGLWMNMYF